MTSDSCCRVYSWTMKFDVSGTMQWSKDIFAINSVSSRLELCRENIALYSRCVLSSVHTTRAPGPEARPGPFSLSAQNMSSVHTAWTYGPDGEKALHDKLFRASGPDVRVTGTHWPFHTRTSGPDVRPVRPARASGPDARAGRPGSVHRALSASSVIIDVDWTS